MTRFLALAAAIWILADPLEAPAQVVVASPPVIIVGPVLIMPRTASNLRGPIYYSVPDSRATIKLIVPTVGMRPRPPVYQDVDLSGVDLDVVGPEALRPGARVDPERLPPPASKKQVEIVDKVKTDKAPAVPPPDQPQRKEGPAPEKPAPTPAKDQKNRGLDEPRAEPLEESRRLLDLGVIAFQARAYGLAALRFGQAVDAAPAQAYPYFVLAQAYVALGKYKQAVEAIESGMRLQEGWPLSFFQPRVDLYQGIEDDWIAHKKQLADVQALHPKRPTYQFLLAYQLWFDGHRAEAIEMFEQAAEQAPDNPFVRAFLKVVPKLAAK